MQGFTRVVVALLATTVLHVPASAEVQIVELLADPPNELAGDVNRDGTRSAIEDEFIELMNTGTSAVNLSDWTLSDAAKVRHTFAAGTTLKPGEMLLVFGGGQPQGFSGQAVTASHGSLSLNNNGDVVTLRDASMAIMDSLSFGSEADRDQSLVRNGSNAFVPHTSLEGASGALFSPGTIIAE